MSTFLHQIFYNYNKFDDESSCKELEKYFLTVENKKRILDLSMETLDKKERVKKEDIAPQVETETLDKRDIFYSNKQNQLFWTIYVAIYGYEQYMAISTKYGNAELEEKQKIIEFLKTGYAKMKETNKKTSKTLIQTWMSEIMSAAKHTISILQVFSVYYKRPIFVYFEEVKSYLYFPHSSEEDADVVPIIVLQNKDGHYGLYHDSAFVNTIKEGICFEDVDKPLKGMSAYKIGDLQELAKKCGFGENETKLKKPELYGMIWKYLNAVITK